MTLSARSHDRGVPPHETARSRAVEPIGGRPARRVLEQIRAALRLAEEVRRQLDAAERRATGRTLWEEAAERTLRRWDTELRRHARLALYASDLERCRQRLARKLEEQAAVYRPLDERLAQELSLVALPIDAVSVARAGDAERARSPGAAPRPQGFGRNGSDPARPEASRSSRALWQAVRLEDYLLALGIRLDGNGDERRARCPLCGRTDALRVNVAKHLWFCRRGCGGGTVLTLDRRLGGPLGEITGLGAGRGGGGWRSPAWAPLTERADRRASR